MSNRFILFAYDNYYPQGGGNDIKGVFNTLDEAKSRMRIDNGYKQVLVNNEWWTYDKVTLWHIDHKSIAQVIELKDDGQVRII